MGQTNESRRGTISDPEDTEAALRRSEERFRATFEQVAVGIAHVSPEGRFLRVNRKFCDIVGYTPDEMLARTFQEITHPDDHYSDRTHLHQLLAGEMDTFSKEKRYIHKNGEIVWVNLTVSMLRADSRERTCVVAVVQDITERKTMEKALTQSEEHYRALSEAAFEAVFISEKGVCLEQNATAEKMFGYSSAEAIGRLGTEWIVPEDREMVMDKMQSGYEGRYKATALRKDGSTFPAEIQARMMQYDGRTVRVTTLTDHTQHKQAEKALEESERKFKALVTNNEEIVYIIDKDGTFLLSEGKGLAKLGLTAGDVVGQSVFELYKDYPQMLGLIKKTFQGETITTELAVAGEFFRNWYTPYRNREGEVIGLLGLSVNTTERKKIELMLKKSEDHLRRAQEIANAGSWELDIVSNDFLWSDEVYRIFGVTRGKPITYEAFLGFVPSEDRDHVVRSWKAALRGEPYDIEHRINVDGEVKWVRQKAQVEFDGRGRAVSGTGIVRDITEQKKSEQKLREYQQRLKALTAELALSEEKERRRIAMELHDQVGQTLAVARIQLATAKKAASDTGVAVGLEEASRTVLQAIHETRDIMYDLSSPTMNEIGLVAAVSEWLENRIRSRSGLETEFTADELKTPLNPDTRAILFRSVRELLTNVVKHARARKVSVRMINAGDTLRIVVEDDGVGFDKHENTLAENHDEGFGLFSIHETMTDMGGYLEIETEPGLGCAAVLVVPSPELNSGGEAKS